MAPRGRRPERGRGRPPGSRNSTSSNSNRDSSGSTQGQEETDEQRRARANRINSENWRQFAVVPSRGNPDMRPELDLLIRESFRLIDPASVADAAATALRNRGLPVPGEESTTAALLQSTASNGNQTAPSGPPASTTNANQAITVSEPAGQAQNRKANDGQSNEPQFRRPAPPSSSAGPVRAQQPTRRSIPERGRVSIATTDLLRCNHYYASDQVAPIRVETATMAFVVYSDHNEVNVYAAQDLPSDPFMDDVLIVISKTNVAFARIPGDLNAGHTLENCRHFTRSLGPWLDTGESVTAYALCPRNSVGEPWYATEKKQLRLNTVYTYMQNFAKNRGSFIFDSYYPTGSNAIECSITVGPVAGEDAATSPGPNSTFPLDQQDSSDLGFGQGDFSSGFGASLDFSGSNNNNNATMNSAIDPVFGQSDFSSINFESTDLWSDMGSTADLTGSSELNQGGYSTNNDPGFGAMQNVPSQNQGFLMSPFDQSYAEELGFYIPGPSRGSSLNTQQRNTYGQGAYGQTTYGQNTFTQGGFGAGGSGQQTFRQNIPSQQQTLDFGALGFRTYGQSRILDLSTQYFEQQNASTRLPRASSTGFPTANSSSNMLDLTTQYLGPQGYFGGQGNNNNNNNTISTGYPVGSQTNLLALPQTMGLGIGFDRTPHTAGRPRVIIRDRIGERIL